MNNSERHTGANLWDYHLRGGTPCSEGSSGLCPQKGKESTAHHQVFHPVAQLVDEQDGEVVHCLPKLNPGGVRYSSPKSASVTAWSLKMSRN